MVSVILPTRQRADQLEKTLHSFRQFIDIKEHFEIIVVDNGSTDCTKEVVSRFIDISKLNAQYINDPVPGLLTGRHRGYYESKGDILTFIDDDVILGSSWLPTIMDVFANHENVHLLTGPSFPFFEEYPPGWLKYFWKKIDVDGTEKHCTWLSLLDLGDSPKFIHPGFVWGLNFSIRRSVFEQLKGFNPDNIPPEYQMFQGDGETGLTIKVQNAGFNAYYHPGVLLYHQTPKSRLTEDYFKKRAYYQGVCDSFTTLRADKVKNIYSLPNTNTKEAIPLDLKIKNHLGSIKHDIYVWIKRRLDKNSKEPFEVTEMKKRIHQSYKDGYDFHQNAYKTNPLVRNWVHKNDYLDYKLPGW